MGAVYTIEARRRLAPLPVMTEVCYCSYEQIAEALAINNRLEILDLFAAISEKPSSWEKMTMGFVSPLSTLPTVPRGSFIQTPSWMRHWKFFLIYIVLFPLCTTPSNLCCSSISRCFISFRFVSSQPGQNSS